MFYQIHYNYLVRIFFAAFKLKLEIRIRMFYQIHYNYLVRIFLLLLN